MADKEASKTISVLKWSILDFFLQFYMEFVFLCFAATPVLVRLSVCQGLWIWSQHPYGLLPSEASQSLYPAIAVLLGA